MLPISHPPNNCMCTECSLCPEHFVWSSFSDSSNLWFSLVCCYSVMMHLPNSQLCSLDVDCRRSIMVMPERELFSLCDFFFLCVCVVFFLWVCVYVCFFVYLWSHDTVFHWLCLAGKTTPLYLPQQSKNVLHTVEYTVRCTYVGGFHI